MATSNKVLMEEARKSLAGKWGLAIKATLVSVLFTLVVGYSIGFIIGLILGVSTEDHSKIASSIANAVQIFLIDGPMAYGSALFYLWISRGQQAEISQIFQGFHTWTRSVLAYLRVGVFTLLWTLLLIVPGIIAAYSYSQVYFIMVDDQNISAKDAMAKSKEMMKGNKWKLFYLGCRFIGWGLLCILTIGIGFLWLVPYMKTSIAKFYEDVSGKTEEAIASVPEIHEIPVAA